MATEFSCLLCHDAGIVRVLSSRLGKEYETTSVCPGAWRDGREWECPSAKEQFPGVPEKEIATFLPWNWTAAERAQVRFAHRLWQEKQDQEGSPSYETLIQAHWGPAGPLPGLGTACWNEAARRAEARRVEGGVPPRQVEGWTPLAAALPEAPATAEPDRLPILVAEVLRLAQERDWPPVHRDGATAEGEAVWREIAESLPEGKLVEAIVWLEGEERLAA